MKATIKKCNNCQAVKELNEFRKYEHGTFSNCCLECSGRRRKLEESGSKECVRCLKTKDKSEFYYGRVCVTCYNKKRYAENRESILSYSKKYHQTEAFHKKRMVYAAKATSKKQCLPFNLDEKDIIIPKFCPVLGIEIKFNNPFNNRDSSPSLDRLVPENGYVKENVRVISDRANRIKSNGTIEEHLRIVEYMRTNGCPESPLKK